MAPSPGPDSVGRTMSPLEITLAVFAVYSALFLGGHAEARSQRDAE